MPTIPPTLLQLAREARKIHAAAVRDLGPDLGGGSLLDLLADNMPQVPLDTLEHVIVVASLPRHPPKTQYSP